MYNKFNTYEEALLPAILDTMQFMRDYNDNNGYTNIMFMSVEKFNELNAYYQEYLDGEITSAQVIEVYNQNKNLIKGNWSSIREGTDGKFYYLVYPKSLNTYETSETIPLPIEVDND